MHTHELKVTRGEKPPTRTDIVLSVLALIALFLVLLYTAEAKAEGRRLAQPERKCFEVDIQVMIGPHSEASDWRNVYRHVHGVICEKN